MALAATAFIQSEYDRLINTLVNALATGVSQARRKEVQIQLVPCSGKLKSGQDSR